MIGLGPDKNLNERCRSWDWQQQPQSTFDMSYSLLIQKNEYDNMMIDDLITFDMS